MDPSSAPLRPARSGPDGTDDQAHDGHAGDSAPTVGGGATSVLTRPEPPTTAVPAGPRHGAGDASDGGDVPAGHGLRGARRVGIGILIGAFLMFAVASLDSVLGAEVPVLGSFASSGVPPRAEEPPPLPPPPDTPGTCLTWNRADGADTAPVDCSQPHLFEQAGRVALADQPVFPPDAAWQDLVAERCTPVVTRYLNGKFDPNGKFRVGALKPTEQRWNEGDKGMRCGLQGASRSGAMLPITGKVAAQDQSAVHPPGTCLALDGRTVGDPTGCAGPHAVETVGVIDLGTRFKEEWPSVEDQDGFLQPACTEAATRFAGNDRVIREKGLTVYWGNLEQESWNAGSRKVNCNVGTLLPDGSGFAALTGSVKGNLVVDGRSAPAAPAPPGAPAARSARPAPSGSPSATQGSPGTAEQPDGEPSEGPGAGQAPDLNIPPGLPGLTDG
ncbi:septum formation family protein [Pseudonocardia sp. C8]|uniref:septum formation family protein n=1 Tax=Pseudonocardia sp. C8 TaxID=2762759 RepID=UPI001642B721|nr:septum formation family protein [Pseudonocardia sp. C8]MBC3194411.1 septum formation family protein [Pseudonocardia sp. C8]